MSTTCSIQISDVILPHFVNWSDLGKRRSSCPDKGSQEKSSFKRQHVDRGCKKKQWCLNLFLTTSWNLGSSWFHLWRKNTHRQLRSLRNSLSPDLRERNIRRISNLEDQSSTFAFLLESCTGIQNGFHWQETRADKGVDQIVAQIKNWTPSAKGIERKSVCWHHGTERRGWLNSFKCITEVGNNFVACNPRYQQKFLGGSSFTTW